MGENQPPPPSDWREHKLLILATLKRLEGMVDKIHADVVYLKAKAGLVGAIAGAVVTVIGALLSKL